MFPPEERTVEPAQASVSVGEVFIVQSLGVSWTLGSLAQRHG